jgi:hypothetical protein
MPNRKTVWKFPLQICDEPVLELPVGAEVLSVQHQPNTGRAGVQLWALCDPEAPKEKRRFFLLGTGHEDGDRCLGRFIGTFQIDGGDFVGHLFEAGDA